ncbi:hypothetical protein PAXRUDRAFT_32524 [Paxillus rubicundulus Ve08.2h10]|uniref:Uncharacterized protein n=1 Tax=Paxillus rubicundulus Ve08.2h10 TaxID=930991 RepID=A0A0D0E4N4_9AGAM|nr:hypothetical protein PAXRUDRAFT_32524 [Paxillus rubicundulus Ve08.2h10]
MLPGSSPINGVKHESCNTADFVTPRINHPIATEAFLSDIFPMALSEDVEAMELYRQRWEEVEHLVPAFAAVREQCSERYQKETKVEDTVSV